MRSVCGETHFHLSAAKGIPGSVMGITKFHFRLNGFDF